MMNIMGMQSNQKWEEQGEDPALLVVRLPNWLAARSLSGLPPQFSVSRLLTTSFH
jgi:hypothetical protein